MKTLENENSNNHNATTNNSDITTTCSPKVSLSDTKHHFKCRSQQFGFGQITRHNIELAKCLHDASLPVKYSETFYTKTLKHLEFSRIGYIGEVPVGIICCRVEPSVHVNNTDITSSKAPQRLHVVTLCVLAPYRRLGVASALLHYVLNKASERRDIVECVLHVWIVNTAAVDLYNRFGIKVIGTVKDYYDNDTSPPDAFFLRRDMPWSDPVADINELTICSSYKACNDTVSCNKLSDVSSKCNSKKDNNDFAKTTSHEPIDDRRVAGAPGYLAVSTSSSTFLDLTDYNLSKLPSI